MALSDLAKEEKNKHDNFLVEMLREFQRTNTPPQWRASFRMFVAFLLAASLWIVLGWLILEQFKSSREFAKMLVETKPKDKEKIELIKQASAQVDNTANNLYAILGPIVTAVTGYFFVAAGAPGAPKKVESSNNGGNSPGKTT